MGKIFKVETIDGNISYDERKINTIEILNPFAGYLEFLDHQSLTQWFFEVYPLTHAHFIAFDTDFPIDKLKEADIFYTTQSYTFQDLGNKWTYGEKSELQYKPLTSEDEFDVNVSDGWFSAKFTWDKIQSSKEFKNNYTLSSEAQKELDKTKWVLVFLTTPFTRSEKGSLSGHIIEEKGTRVSDVTILRLKFVTAGKTYNLGAVSDKVTESDRPSGGAKDLGWLDLLCKWLEQVTGVPAWVWKIIICALPFVILLPILSAIFPVFGSILSIVLKAIGTAFVWLFKGVWWLVCLPFRGIAALVRKIRNKGEQSHA